MQSQHERLRTHLFIDLLCICRDVSYILLTFKKIQKIILIYIVHQGPALWCCIPHSPVPHYLVQQRNCQNYKTLVICWFHKSNQWEDAFFCFPVVVLKLTQYIGQWFILHSFMEWGTVYLKLYHSKGKLSQCKTIFKPIYKQNTIFNGFWPEHYTQYYNNGDNNVIQLSLKKNKKWTTCDNYSPYLKVQFQNCTHWLSINKCFPLWSIVEWGSSSRCLPVSFKNDRRKKSAKLVLWSVWNKKTCVVLLTFWGNIYYYYTFVCCPCVLKCLSTQKDKFCPFFVLFTYLSLHWLWLQNNMKFCNEVRIHGNVK